MAPMRITLGLWRTKAMRHQRAQTRYRSWTNEPEVVDTEMEDVTEELDTEMKAKQEEEVKDMEEMEDKVGFCLLPL
ncbi:hypothetical protein LINPERHAP1_LOCUS19106 [Linum perenne]